MDFIKANLTPLAINLMCSVVAFFTATSFVLHWMVPPTLKLSILLAVWGTMMTVITSDLNASPEKHGQYNFIGFTFVATISFSIYAVILDVAYLPLQTRPPQDYSRLDGVLADRVVRYCAFHDGSGFSPMVLRIEWRAHSTQPTGCTVVLQGVPVFSLLPLF